MVRPTHLRPQASEFQPQKGKSAASSSNTVTAVPTPVQTPAPNTAASRETSEQIRERVAADNRGSFSTLTEPMSPDHDEITVNQPFSSKGSVENVAGAASEGDMINEVTKMVNEFVVAPGVNKSSPNVNTSIVRPNYGMTIPQYHSPNATYVRYAPGQGYNPFASPYTYQVQPYFTTSGMYANSGTTSNLVSLQGQTVLSSGSDPISEGRRIYIGNLKFSVDRNGIKRLLRYYNVNHTVEKIYMPYSDVPLDCSVSGVDGRGDHSRSMKYTPDSDIIIHHHNSGDTQRGDGELSNKGFVFVTYGNAYEAEEAIQRLSGVMHHDRRLVCRPGLPKGVAFRQPDTGTYRGGKRRRGKMFRGGRFDDGYRGQFQGRSDSDGFASYGARESTYDSYDNGVTTDGYVGGGYAPRSSMDSSYFYGGSCGTGGQRYSMDSGYRSGAPSTWKGSDGYIYGNTASGYHH